MIFIFILQLLILSCLNVLTTEALPQLDQLLSQGGSLLSNLIRFDILIAVSNSLTLFYIYPPSHPSYELKTIFFSLIYVFLTPPALPDFQVHVGAIGCLEQTNNLGNLGAGTPTWSLQGHQYISSLIASSVILKICLVFRRKDKMSISFSLK